jgi:hypothetical protein
LWVAAIRRYSVRLRSAERDRDTRPALAIRPARAHDRAGLAQLDLAAGNKAIDANALAAAADLRRQERSGRGWNNRVLDDDLGRPRREPAPVVLAGPNDVHGVERRHGQSVTTSTRRERVGGAADTSTAAPAIRPDGEIVARTVRGARGLSGSLRASYGAEYPRAALARSPDLASRARRVATESRSSPSALATSPAVEPGLART